MASLVTREAYQALLDLKRLVATIGSPDFDAAVSEAPFKNRSRFAPRTRRLRLGGCSLHRPRGPMPLRMFIPGLLLSLTSRATQDRAEVRVVSFSSRYAPVGDKP